MPCLVALLSVIPVNLHWAAKEGATAVLSCSQASLRLPQAQAVENNPRGTKKGEESDVRMFHACVARCVTDEQKHHRCFKSSLA